MNKYSKSGNRTALGLILSLGIIAASTSSQAALWGLFGEEKEPLKTEKRVPALNSSAGYTVAPDPNLVYGSLPAARTDYPQPAALPKPAISSSSTVQLNMPPSPSGDFVALPSAQFTPVAPLGNPMGNAAPAVSSAPLGRPAPMAQALVGQFQPAPINAAPRAPMGMPGGMPAGMQGGPVNPPAPPSDAFLFSQPAVPVQQFQAPAPQFQAPAPQFQAAAPVAPLPNFQPAPLPQPTYVGKDGYPKLSSIPAQPVPQTVPSNARAESLKAELNASKNMAGQPVVEAKAPVLNAAPVKPVAPMAPIAQVPAPVALPQAVAIPAAPQFAPVNPAPAAVASVQPVFPSGPSVTVRSKRAGGGVVANAPVANVPSPALVAAPLPPAAPAVNAPAPIATAPVALAPTGNIAAAAIDSNTDIALATPSPLVDKAPMPPAPKTVGAAYAPSPVVAEPITREKFVSEASAPVASSYDTPIDSYVGAGSYGLSDNSHTVGNSRTQVRYASYLPKSRYENYRKNNR